MTVLFSTEEENSMLLIQGNERNFWMVSSKFWIWNIIHSYRRPWNWPIQISKSIFWQKQSLSWKLMYNLLLVYLNFNELYQIDFQKHYLIFVRWQIFFFLKILKTYDFSCFSDRIFEKFSCQLHSWKTPNSYTISPL